MKFVADLLALLALMFTAHLAFKVPMGHAFMWAVIVIALWKIKWQLER